MRRKNMLEVLGAWAFIIGVFVALFVGILSGFMRMSAEAMATSAAILVVLGLVVGALNVTDREINSLIIAAIGLSVGSVTLTQLGDIMAVTEATEVIGTMLKTAFTVFGSFVAGVVLIPSLKSVYKISKD